MIDWRPHKKLKADITISIHPIFYGKRLTLRFLPVGQGLVESKAYLESLNKRQYRVPFHRRTYRYVS